MRDLTWQEVVAALRERWVRWRGRGVRTAKQRVGDRGEARAARFLVEEYGFRILERNWRQGRFEIDLVALDREVLVFVEVRSRKAGSRVGGYASVGRKKRNTLRQAIKIYLNSQRRRAPHFRFDIVEIAHSSSGEERLSHYAGIELFHRHFH